MDLSVVILSYNNKNLLQKCLDSISKYTKKIKFEIIVTDNGSSDGTIEMLRTKYPNVKLVDNAMNMGFSRANNNGIAKAIGKYLLILNDDTYIDNDAFSEVLSYMDKEAKVGICGPKLLNPDGTIQKQGSILSAGKWTSKVPVGVQMVIGACMFIRTAVIKEIGNFDQNLFFYNDDLDMCLRTRKSGNKVVYYPLAHVYHYGGYSSKKSANYALFVEGVLGGLYFCKKHYLRPFFELYRAFILITALIMTVLSFYNADKRKAYARIFNRTLKQDLVHKY